MNTHRFSGIRAAVLPALIPAALLSALLPMPANAATVVRIGNDGCFLIALGTKLGYFSQEGIELKVVRVEDINPSKDDWDTQISMNRGQIDANLNWFHHAYYGAGNAAPVKAVMLIQNAAEMKVLVANRVKDQIRSAADFKDRTISTGALFSSKTYLTQYLMIKAGVPAHQYRAIGIESEGRKETVIKALDAGQVDVMTFMEPMATDLLATGKTTVLYDISSKDGAIAALGTYWPARCILVTPTYIKEHPDIVQHLVNGFVRTMRYVNAHSPEEVVAALPKNYFDGMDKAGETRLIRLRMPSYARDDYTIDLAAAKTVVDAARPADFDESGEGQFRKHAATAKVAIDQLFDNRFVTRAMAEIK